MDLNGNLLNDLSDEVVAEGIGASVALASINLLDNALQGAAIRQACTLKGVHVSLSNYAGSIARRPQVPPPTPYAYEEDEFSEAIVYR